ncbi:MAG TPA: nucleoside-diphosphate kinase [Candidatus Brocadiia bacterium]|nr:nucleoside-diphosphate kinase [Candidatus Brocadiia bacterium]
MDRTLVILKPDTVQRRLIGTIIARIEKRGLQIAAMRMARATPEQIKNLYSPHEGKHFYDALVRYASSGPVVLMALEGLNAIQVVRAMLGKTFCSEAQPGTIRGDFGLSNRFNLIHASDSPEAAKRELAIFFQPNDFLDYTPCDVQWVYDLSGQEPV